MSRGRSQAAVLRLGTLTVIVLVIAMAAAFNLQRFPGFRGTGYHAEFSDASGLRKGQMVQIAGIRVGRISHLRLAGDRVVVDFDIDPGVQFGPDSRASVEVLNLLGEKFLQIEPAGSGQLRSGGTIGLERTSAGYDIVSVLGDLTETTEGIDSDQLGSALDTLAATLDSSAPEIRSSFRGLSRLSRSIASRDASLGRLLDDAKNVTDLLAQRRGDLVTLMKQARVIFRELQVRRTDIRAMLTHTRQLSRQLTGLVADTEADLGPALKELRSVTTMLKEQKANIDATTAAMGQYADIMINILGTGPWFDGYVPNLAGLGTGEFVPGKR